MCGPRWSRIVGLAQTEIARIIRDSTIEEFPRYCTEPVRTASRAPVRPDLPSDVLAGTVMEADMRYVPALAPLDSWPVSGETVESRPEKGNDPNKCRTCPS